MTSDTYPTPGVSSSSATAAASSRAPDVSNRVAGTQGEAPNRMVNGVRDASSSIQRTPSIPRTLAISWGSDTVATVPWRTTSRANSLGGRRLLSMCTWASTKPGAR